MRIFNSFPTLLFVLVSSAAAGSTLPQTDIDQAARLMRQARDTQNPADFRQAGAAAAKALAADPESFDAQRYDAMALLGQQDLTGALALASRLNKRVPDDIGIWAILSEIHAARGEYEEAERCAQWVLDLRRNSPLGFSTAARLREIHGDSEGAAEFYGEALRRTPQSDLEERSWLMVQNARLLLRAKNPSAAGSFLEQAGKLFPNSVQVLEQQAQLARMKGDLEGTASLLAKATQASPTAAHLYAYAQALERAGRHDEAASTYQRFEAAAATAGSELILYYADQKQSPEEAVALARRRVAERRDVATLDAYAWSLYRAGQFDEARTEMDQLLALGTRDPQYVCHAARIAAAEKSGDSCEIIP